MKIAMEWKVDENGYINVVTLRGKIAKNYGLKSDFLRAILLESACTIIGIAVESHGRLLPLEKPPAEKNVNSVYFEIIFKSTADCKTFLNAINNKLS